MTALTSHASLHDRTGPNLLHPAALASVFLALASPPTSAAERVDDTALPRARAAHVRGAREHVHLDVDSGGAIWARGSAYKARFDAHGATYVPFLGSRAPRNFPVTFALVRAHGDAGELALSTPSNAVLEGERVVLDRGPVDEVYELGLDGVEQTFVIEERPASSSLTLVVAVTSELAPRDGAGLEFANALGGVRYGSAFLRAQDGSKRPVPSRYVDGSVVIDVPAHELERATFPLVVDPVLSTFAVDNSPADTFHADVAWDASTDTLMVAMEEVFSATDHDVYVEYVDVAGVQIASGYADQSSEDWREPQCANLDHADQFTIVAAQGLGVGNLVRGRSTPASSIAFAPKFTIDSGAITEKFSPDIGTDPTFSASAGYLVVYTTDTGAIRSSAWRTLDRTGVVGTVSSYSGVATNARCIVSNSNHGSLWLVMDRSGATLSNDVYAWTVDTTGASVSGATIVTNAPGDFAEPAAASRLDDGTFVVGWQERTAGVNDIKIKLLSDTLATLDQRVLSTLEGSGTLAEDQRTLSLDSDGETVLAAYAESIPGSATDYDLFLTEMFVLGGALGVSDGHLRIDANANLDELPQVTSAKSSGGAANSFAFAWDRVGSIGTANVLAGFYTGFDGGPVDGFCYGDGSGTACPCANVGGAGRGCPHSANPLGARLRANGSADLSSDTLVLVASDLPATTSCLFFQGNTQIAGGGGSLFGDGLRCTSGGVVRLGTKTAVAGATSYPQGGDATVSVRGAVPATGAVRYYQAWFRNAVSFCTADTFNTTNALSVTWLP